MAVILRGIEEARCFLDSVLSGERKWDPELEPLEFEGELRSLKIEIDGPGFDGEITGEVARALAAYQDAIYSFAKVVCFGDENVPGTRLPAEVRRAFEFSVAVSEGCTEVSIDLKPVMEGAGDNLRKMDSKTFANLMIVLAVVAALGINGYVLGSKFLDNQNAADQREHVEETLTTAMNGQREIVSEMAGLLRETALAGAGPSVANYARSVVGSLGAAQSVGVTELAKAAPTATSINFGATQLDSDAIAAINKRAPRAKAEPYDITGEFKVYAETLAGKPTKLTFHGRQLPSEVEVDFEELVFSEEQCDAMWKAIREKTAINVSLQGLVLRDKVKGAVLVDIHVD